MPKLSKSREAKVEAFLVKTGASRTIARKMLEQWDWNVELATQRYYVQNPNYSTNLDNHLNQTCLEQLYRRYKDEHEDMIMAEGISRLCADLQVDPQDIVMLVMSWHMKAATMCEFSKQEFFNGLKKLKADSIEKFRSAIPAMRSELKDKNKFEEVYNFTFGWAKEKGQKSLHLDTAIGMWQLLFAEMSPKWPYVAQWCEFLEERHKLAIAKDTWTQLLLFVRNVNPSLTNFDEGDSWPYLVDEFVDYLKEKGLVQISG